MITVLQTIKHKNICFYCSNNCETTYLESGNGTNSILCSEVVELIDIDFAEQYVGLFLGHFLKGRLEVYARTTPLCIPVDHHKLPCGLHFFEVFPRSDIVHFARRNVADTSTKSVST